MKFTLIPILYFIVLTTNGQVVSFGDPDFVGNNLSKVVEKSIKHPDSWREFYFDNNSKLIEKKYYRNYKEVENIKYHYKENDSVLITKEIINPIGFSEYTYTNKSYYDSNKRLKRFEEYSPKDSLIPFIIEDNINYDKNGKINSYERKLNNQNGSVTNSYKLEFNKDSSVLTVKENNSNMTVVFKYNHKGNMTDLIIDYHDPLAVIGGARTWSRNKRDKYQVSYKYDKYGNWIMSYSVTKFWRYRLEKRTITYK